MRLLAAALLVACACALPHPQSETLSEAAVASFSDAELLEALTGKPADVPPPIPEQPATAAPEAGLSDAELLAELVAELADVPPTGPVQSGAGESSALVDGEPHLTEAGSALGANQGQVVRCQNAQYVCVPYYLCHEDEIITDGVGLIDIRFGSKQSLNETNSLSHSECPKYTDVCCRKQKPRVIDPEPIKYQPRCGHRNEAGVNARIVGFSEGQSQFGEFPWMAAVLRVEEVGGQEKNLFVCGGALIHPQVVMTAAHCVNNSNSAELRVRLGEWDTQHTTEFYSHVDIAVATIDAHVGYNGRNLHNDIALLFLAEPVELQEHIDTLCLPEPGRDFDYTDCVATGWGKDRFDGGQYQTVLKLVDLQRVDSDYCQKQLRTTRLGGFFVLDDSFTCAGAPPRPQDAASAQPASEQGKSKPAADTCTGDGGSPLACRDPADGSRYVHGGIVAYGIGCGEKDIPGVYADPQYFAGWIDEHVSTYFNLATPYYGFWKPALVAGQQP